MKQNVRGFFTIMVIYSWQQGRIKGGGVVQLLLPLNFFWGKVKKRYKEDEKWMGREVVVPVNIFSRGDIFGGWLRNFQGGHMLETPPPPRNLLLFF